MQTTQRLRILNLRSQHGLFYPCRYETCNRWFKSRSGLTCHQRSEHGLASSSYEDGISSESDESMSILHNHDSHGNGDEVNG